MLRKQINIQNGNKPEEITLSFNDIILSGETIVFQMDKEPVLQGEYEIQLVRKDGSQIYYAEKENGGINGNELNIKNFPKRVLPPLWIEKIKVQRDLTSEDSRHEAYLVKFDKPHYMISNRDNVDVKGYVINGIDSVRDYSRRCGDDFVIASLNQDKADEIKNEYFYLYKGTKEEPILQDDKYVCKSPINSVSEIENPFTGSIYSVEVPVSNDGQDYEDILLVYADEDITSTPYFLCDDERFVKYDKDDSISLKNGVYGYYISNHLQITLPLAEDFSLKLTREQELNQYSEILANKSINEIVDYERQQFQPYFIRSKDGELCPATEIEFNLHFREHDTQNGWSVKDGGFWNNYGYNAATNSLSHIKDATGMDYLQDNDSDLLGNIGFDDDDINSQAMSLQQSFLRISFYDTPYRGNQNLLFYNAIFFDANKAYSKYVKAVAQKQIESDYSTYQWPSGNPLRLGATFNVYSKYNASGSSEGFYLYLFKGVVEGKQPTTIYMKVEFNHAKYGKTVPFILPMDTDGAVISPISKKFPINYYKIEKKDNKVYGSIDMSGYTNDMYIPITVKYDEISDKYLWYTPLPQDDGKLIFNLYEPRLNPSQDSEYSSRRDGDTASTKLVYSETDNYFIKMGLSLRTSGTKHLCSKKFLKTVENMSINGKIVETRTNFNFSAASNYEVVFKLKEDTNGKVENGALADVSGITELRFNDNITSIGSGVAANSTLNELYIGKGCETIGTCAFAGCKFLSVLDLEKCIKLSTIGLRSFQGCIRLYDIKLPMHSLIIGVGAFGRTAITKLIIPDNSTIGRHAFSRCYQLENIDGLGNNLQIDISFRNSLKPENDEAYGIFRDCRKLTSYMDYNTNIKQGMNYVQVFKKFGMDISNLAGVIYEKDTTKTLEKLFFLSKDAKYN